MKWIDKKEELRKAIEDDKRGYEELGRLYNVSGTYIKQIAQRLGINTLPRRAKNPKETFGKGVYKKPLSICEFCGKEFIRYSSSGNKYCSCACSAKAKKQQSIEQWKIDPSKGTCNFTCSRYVREYLFEKVNCKCEKCGWGEINPYTKKVPLQIHHIDGNSLNNEESNLQVLCPNCHALTENFGSRNKNAPNGKSQYYRRA